MLTASPLAETAPITSSFAALPTVTEGVLLVAAAPPAVPIGVVWSTPVRLMALAATLTLPLIATVTLAVPTDGLIKYQMLTSLLLEFPFRWIACVSATPP